MLDTDEWRKIIGNNVYGTVSNDLRKEIAIIARQLCSESISNPDSIEALMNCRLIPLSQRAQMLDLLVSVRF